MATDLSWNLPDHLSSRVRDRLADMRRRDVVRRIWDRDPAVWSSGDEDRWLGWLTLPMQPRDGLDRIRRLGVELKAEGIRDIVLLGMGGSSLAPEVFSSVIGRADGSPVLHVLDSTDPAQLLAAERAVDFRHTLFLVASKSGSTLEVNILKQYFFQRAVEQLGATEAGRHFVLTTDPGSKMALIAQQERFREVFDGIATVGGRYSALSNFGLVPAALVGIDVNTVLDRAAAMARQCSAEDDSNSAFELGVLLGELALNGCDKPTLIAPAAVAPFGAWLEQLVAESLGKQGKGILPVDGEPLAEPELYGSDRVFVHFRSAGGPDAAMDSAVERLARAGHPVVRIDWADRHALGAEFFRWEFATAVAGAVLGVNPFDQPDVEATKVVTRRLATEYERTGELPANQRVSSVEAAADLIRELRQGDYFAILAFIQMNDQHRNALDAIRRLVRDATKAATTVGFGPRYLHSTGQGHKGGPDSGVFLLITCDDVEDVPVPGQKYTFGTIKLIQALADFEVLAARGRRICRVHLENVESGLRALHSVLHERLLQ